MLFMPPFFNPQQQVLETIPCDYTELLVRYLYNLYKPKRARKFALPAPPIMQICEGASFPRRLLGLLSWSYQPTCSANESDPSNPWRARFSSPLVLSEFQYNFCFFHDFACDSFTFWISSNFYVLPRCFGF